MGTTGRPPSARTGHCATLLEDKRHILIHGGWDPNQNDEEMSNHCYMLDTHLWRWSLVKPIDIQCWSACDQGQKKAGHSAVLLPSTNITQIAYQQKLIFFGGRIPNDKFVNDIQLLSFS